LEEKSVQRITQKIESIWARSDVDPDFKKALHLALPIFNSSTKSYENLTRWMILPNMCCHAAGGQSHWADDTTAAWILFYVGAHIMDSVEDQDPPDDWWKSFGPGLAINIASVFYFSASKALQDLYKHERSKNVATDVIDDFNQSFLIMCEGQHNDLLQKEPSLDQYWEIAGAKSGTFFSLACRSGARLATDDIIRIEAFSKFGYHLGVLIQILDDLEDLDPEDLIDLFDNRDRLYSTLPFVYALEVSTTEEREKLLVSMNSEEIDKEMFSEIVSLIDKSGAVIYILAEIEKHRSKAIESLIRADPISPAKEMLTARLEGLGKI
jgi:geranylgeranyl pyrophosphate synthase